MGDFRSIEPTRPTPPSAPLGPEKRERAQQYLKLCQIEADIEALKRYDHFLTTLAQKDRDKSPFREQTSLLAPHEENTERAIQQYAAQKWQTTQELQTLFSSLKRSIETEDPESCLESLLQVADAEINPKMRAHASYQKIFNQTFKEIFGSKKEGQEGTDDLTLQLYLCQSTSRATKKWGATTLHSLQKGMIDQLGDQAFTAAESDTPFSEAAQDFSETLSTMDEASFAHFVSPDNEKKLRDQLMAMITDTMFKSSTKTAVQKGARSLNSESSEATKGRALEEASSIVRSQPALQHVSDEAMRKEISLLEDAIMNLEQDPQYDQNKIAALKKQLKDIRAAYESSSSVIDYTGLKAITAEIKKITYDTLGPNGVPNDKTINALNDLISTLKIMKDTVDQGDAAIVDAIAKLEELKKIKDISHTVDDMHSLIERLYSNNPPLTREEYARLMEDYLKLTKESTTTPPLNIPKNIQDQIDNLIKTVRSTTINGGKASLLEMMAASYLALQAPKGPMSLDEMRNWINSQLAHAGGITDKSLQEAFKKILNSRDDFGAYVVDPVTGKPLFSFGEDALIHVDSNWGKNSDPRFDDNFLDLVRASRSASKIIGEQIKNLDADIAALKYAQEQIKALKDKAYELDQILDGMSRTIISGQSLTDAFKDVILGDYTNWLQGKLGLLVYQLKCKSGGSRVIAAGADKLTDWANVSTTGDPPHGFNTDSWASRYDLEHPKGADISKYPDKKYNIDDVKKHAQEEINDINQKIEKGKAAETALDTELQAAKAEGRSTPELEQKIKDAKAAIENNIGAMKNLQAQLTEITKITDTGDAARDKVKDICSRAGGVKESEMVAINGKVDPKDPKKTIEGIVQTQSSLLNDAKKWGEQGTELQLQLSQMFGSMNMIYQGISGAMQILMKMMMAWKQ